MPPLGWPPLNFKTLEADPGLIKLSVLAKHLLIDPNHHNHIKKMIKGGISGNIYLINFLAACPLFAQLGRLDDKHSNSSKVKLFKSISISYIELIVNYNKLITRIRRVGETGW